MYDSTISYAYISRYDADEFLLHGDISHLTAKFINARETVQRVNLNTVKQNHEVMSLLTFGVVPILAFIYVLNESLHLKWITI